MQNRYIVKSYDREIMHMIDPGVTVWYIHDRKLNQAGLSYYMTEKAAQEMCDRRNARQ